MKKILITLVAVIVLACALFVVASAADYGYLADDLNGLGLFKGTDSGYALDNQSTRAEAVTMLVRLLGKEDDALAGGYTHPFTDVPAWASPYIAYAYENGLTNGLTDTTFGPSNPCSAQMFTTFVLRALGYDDSAGDFTYADAIDFGKGVGIIDDALAAGDFLRDQMVAVSFRALFTAPNDGNYDTLLQKLIADGAIDPTASASVLDKFALIDEFSNVGSELKDETRIAMTIAMDAEMSALGQDAAITANMDMSIIRNEDYDILASIKMDVDEAGTQQSVQMYIADGSAYVDDGTQKIKMDLGLSGLDSILSMADVKQYEYTPYMISDISKYTEGDFTVYSVKLADSFMSDTMSQVLGALGGGALGDLPMKDMSLTFPSMLFYIDKTGALNKIEMTMDMQMTISTEGATVPVSINATMEYNITATGDAVSVTLPADLDEYVPQDIGAPVTSVDVG